MTILVTIAIVCAFLTVLFLGLAYSYMVLNKGPKSKEQIEKESALDRMHEDQVKI